MGSQDENARSLANSGFLRLPQIIGPGGRIPVSKSTWWAGIRSGRFPRPVKITRGVTAWRQSDIDALVARLSENTGPGESKQVTERPRTR